MNVRFIKSAAERRQYPRLRLPRIAFAGRSNVGKSSLINSLLGRKKLARTSATPGRTQVINFFDIDGRWVFVDLPGYGYAKVPKKVRARWAPMIEEFLREDDQLRLAVMIVDSRHEPSPLDVMLKEWLEEYEIPYQVVATKSDKLSRSRLAQSIARIERELDCSVVPYSAATGAGKKPLWQIIERI